MIFPAGTRRASTEATRRTVPRSSGACTGRSRRPSCLGPRPVAGAARSSPPPVRAVPRPGDRCRTPCRRSGSRWSPQRQRSRLSCATSSVMVGRVNADRLTRQPAPVRYRHGFHALADFREPDARPSALRPRKEASRGVHQDPGVPEFAGHPQRSIQHPRGSGTAIARSSDGNSASCASWAPVLHVTTNGRKHSGPAPAAARGPSLLGKVVADPPLVVGQLSHKTCSHSQRKVMGNFELHAQLADDLLGVDRRVRFRK